MRATREDSGWNTAEPMPTIATAASTIPNVGAEASSSKPPIVNVMPAASEYGFGCLSVYQPTTGCSNEAVSWEVSAIKPTCPKSSVYAFFKIGYTAGSTDCIMSFNR